MKLFGILFKAIFYPYKNTKKKKKFCTRQILIDLQKFSQLLQKSENSKNRNDLLKGETLRRNKDRRQLI